jgi:colanic acid biosynthesis protein WcaH
MKSMLDDATFKTVIYSTPLISIDLVVRDSSGRVLLGQRLNRPAKGFWFVPGGRIRKDEALSSAFKRLTRNELGLDIDIKDARYLGLYEHFYPDSIFTNEKTDTVVSTHYIVNAFEVLLGDIKHEFPEEQHGAYQWFSETELMESKCVHTNSKLYFKSKFGYLNK